MILLCIDWGNTRVKAAVMAEPDQFIAEGNYAPEDALKEIAALIDKHQPRASVLSSVAKHDPELEVLLQERTHYVPLNAKTPLPIMNAYHSDTLGMDRLAAVAGMHAANPGKNNLVITLGTCATYNFITNNGAFRGGAISPGLQMRLDA